MSLATGTYTGNGSYQRISVGFRPELVIIKRAAADYLAFKVDDLWCGRANNLGAADSFASSVRLASTGFAVGSHARVNTNGDTFHYLALARSSDFKMAMAGWQGNGAARTIQLDDSAVTPSAVIVKRDSTRDAAILVSGSTCARMGGTTNAEAGAISNFAAGSFDVSSSVYVNEYDPALELGEGINGIAWEAGANIAVTTYLGDGTQNRTITLPFTPKAVIVQKVDGAALSARLKTDTMPSGDTAPATNAALQSNQLSIVTNGVQTGSSTSLNGSGENYCLIAFKDHSTAALAAPAVRRSGRKAVLLPGRGATSWIDCGTDASLVVDGALTLEWMGSLEPTGRTTPTAMMWRGSGTGNTSTTCSFAFYANSFSPGDWSGPQFAIGCADRIDLALASTEIRSSWRTGLIPEFGRFNHWAMTHNGSGVWKLYKNGRLVRLRSLDLTGVPLPNIDGQAGHRMVLGAMYNSGAPANMQRQYLMLARIYNRALTAAEVTSRFARAGLRSSEADVTSGLVEEWDAANASGSSLPATVASANNGTITGGSVEVLT